MSKKKAHKLDYLPDYDFIVLGIISDEKDYKLVWSINNTLGWNFERMENHRFYKARNKTELQFPLFSFTDEESYTNYKLLSNKHEGFALLDDFKNLDYVFIILSHSDKEDLAVLIEKIKRINGIRAVYQIDNKNIKNKDFLDFH